MGVTDIYICRLHLTFHLDGIQENNYNYYKYNQDLLLTSIAHAQIDVSKMD